MTRDQFERVSMTTDKVLRPPLQGMCSVGDSPQLPSLGSQLLILLRHNRVHTILPQNVVKVISPQPLFTSRGCELLQFSLPLLLSVMPKPPRFVTEVFAFEEPDWRPLLCDTGNPSIERIRDLDQTI